MRTNTSWNHMMNVTLFDFVSPSSLVSAIAFCHCVSLPSLLLFIHHHFLPTHPLHIIINFSSSHRNRVGPLGLATGFPIGPSLKSLDSLITQLTALPPNSLFLCLPLLLYLSILTLLIICVAVALWMSWIKSSCPMTIRTKRLHSSGWRV